MWNLYTICRVKHTIAAISPLVVAKFHTKKVWENRIFDHRANNLNSHLTIFKELQKSTVYLMKFSTGNQTSSTRFCSGGLGANSIQFINHFYSYKSWLTAIKYSRNCWEYLRSWSIRKYCLFFFLALLLQIVNKFHDIFSFFTLILFSYKFLNFIIICPRISLSFFFIFPENFSSFICFSQA